MRTQEQVKNDIKNQMKMCGTCGKLKDFEDFYKNKRGPDGRHSVCKKCRNKTKTEWRTENKDKHDYSQRSFHYKKKYSITVEQYELILENQDRSCACCGMFQGDNLRFSKVERLSVDHDHITGKVRGLLCHRCNSGIGFLGETVDNLMMAVDYLRRTV